MLSFFIFKKAKLRFLSGGTSDLATNSAQSKAEVKVFEKICDSVDTCWTRASQMLDVMHGKLKAEVLHPMVSLFTPS